MLNQLLANLPFNPGLIDQVAFYGKRLRQESSIRRIGFIFAALALLVQIFAVISPPQASLAASSNDLINGGFRSAGEAANDCRSNIESYGTILANYGITCDRVASANTITINSADWGGNLWSMGRLPYGIAGETPINVPGVGTLYIRYLNGWGNSNYEALNVTATGGQTFLLLYNCGNLTSVGPPVPVQKPPALTLSKTTSPGGPVANSTVSPGTILFYRLVFNNNGGPAKNVTVSDHEPANTSFNWISLSASDSHGFDTATNTANWVYSSMPAGAANYYVDVKFAVNANAANGTQICNVATLSATGVATITSNRICMTVKVNAPKPPVTPPAPPVCPSDSSILKTNKLCVVCPYNSSIIQSNPQCKPCTASLSSQDTTACIENSKQATNLTQNISNADGTTAQPGDTIQYTLIAKNAGKATVKNYVIQENLSDVLDYADVQNLNGGALNNTTDVLSWPAVNIAAGQSVQKTFTVKVKDPIPSTPQSTSDPMHFDHIMTNVYGNTINIDVPETIIEASAQAAQTSLPNTGPGTSLLIGGGIVIVVGYFLARSRLLAKETALVASDFTSTGGF